MVFVIIHAAAAQLNTLDCAIGAHLVPRLTLHAKLMLTPNRAANAVPVSLLVRISEIMAGVTR
jgi:hypothetical protein